MASRSSSSEMVADSRLSRCAFQWAKHASQGKAASNNLDAANSSNANCELISCATFMDSVMRKSNVWAEDWAPIMNRIVPQRCDHATCFILVRRGFGSTHRWPFEAQHGCATCLARECLVGWACSGPSLHQVGPCTSLLKDSQTRQRLAASGGMDCPWCRLKAPCRLLQSPGLARGLERPPQTTRLPTQILHR